MPKPLFLVTCCLLLTTAHAMAAEPICPPPATQASQASGEHPSDAVYHAAMLAASRSATERLDWVVDSEAKNPCGGYYQEPENPSPDKHLPPEQADLRLSADEVSQHDDGVIRLAGNVELHHGRRRLRCDAMLLDQQQQFSEISGNIQLREPGLLLMAEKAILDGQDNSGEFIQAQYLLHEQQAHGQSARITFEGGDNPKLNLEDTSFTLCPPTAKHWSFSAKSLEIDREKGWGTLRSGFFRIADVPVLYLPYLDFPIDDRRKSGFLWPSISGSGSGVDIAVPYYLNLAPHYDMTYTPRYNSEHGYLHNLELRYKQRYSEWAIGGSYIHDDSKVGDIQTADDDDLDSSRWLAFLHQDGRFNQNWSSHIDYQAVSDINYLRDWGTTGLDVQRSLNLRRIAELQFNHHNWYASARVIDYENLEFDPDTGQARDSEYRQLPAIDLVYRNHRRAFVLEPLFTGQYIYYDHNRFLTGQRAYLEPGLSFPMRWQALEVIPAATFKHTQFILDSSNNAGQAHQQDGEYRGQHSISVPAFSLDSRLFLEREYNDGLRHIISPRIRYYYARFQDQDGLPNFDSSPLAFSYQQLWRDSRFGSYDRISDAEQISLALENRWLSRHGRTLFDVNIGQILYFRDRQVSALAEDRTLLTSDPADSANEARYKAIINREIEREYQRDSSDIALQANWYLSHSHRLRGDYIWDPYRTQSREAALGWHYSDDNQRIFNLAYRYRRELPLLTDDDDLFQRHTDQLDGSFYLPVSEQWHGYMRINYDIQQNEPIENIAGLKYEGCCWALMLAFKRERKTFENNMRIADTASADYQNSWYIQFELTGLGGVTNTINRLLQESIRGYR